MGSDLSSFYVDEVFRNNVCESNNLKKKKQNDHFNIYIFIFIVGCQEKK